jgi:hypothetical protein
MDRQDRYMQVTAPSADPCLLLPIRDILVDGTGTKRGLQVATTEASRGSLKTQLQSVPSYPDMDESCLPWN